MTEDPSLLYPIRPAPNLSGATGAVGPFGGGGGGGSRTCASGFLGNEWHSSYPRFVAEEKGCALQSSMLLSSHRIDCFSFFRKKKSY